MSFPVTFVNKLGDGFCENHSEQVTITFITGSSNVSVNNQSVCVANITTGTSTCGHDSIAITGSSSVSVNNLPIHRINDTGELKQGGQYTVITGSSNVSVG